MSYSAPLYPPGHPPFVPRDVRGDDVIVSTIQKIAQTPDVANSLLMVRVCMWSRVELKKMRAYLFRVEQLMATNPCLPRHFMCLPVELAALLETLKAAQHCVEEWMESETCHAILAQYQTPPALRAR